MPEHFVCCVHYSISNLKTVLIFFVKHKMHAVESNKIKSLLIFKNLCQIRVQKQLVHPIYNIDIIYCGGGGGGSSFPRGQVSGAVFGAWGGSADSFSGGGVQIS